MIGIMKTSATRMRSLLNTDIRAAEETIRTTQSATTTDDLTGKTATKTTDMRKNGRPIGFHKRARPTTKTAKQATRSTRGTRTTGTTTTTAAKATIADTPTTTTKNAAVLMTEGTEAMTRRKAEDMMIDTSPTGQEDSTGMKKLRKKTKEEMCTTKVIISNQKRARMETEANTPGLPITMKDITTDRQSMMISQRQPTIKRGQQNHIMIDTEEKT